MQREFTQMTTKFPKIIKKHDLQTVMNEWVLVGIRVEEEALDEENFNSLREETKNLALKEQWRDRRCLFLYSLENEVSYTEGGNGDFVLDETAEQMSTWPASLEHADEVSPQD